MAWPSNPRTISVVGTNEPGCPYCDWNSRNEPKGLHYEGIRERNVGPQEQTLS